MSRVECVTNEARDNAFLRYNDSIKQCSEFTLKYLDGDEQVVEIEKLRLQMLQHCELDQQWAGMLVALQKTNKVINNSKGEDNLEPKKILDAEFAKVKLRKPEDHDWYKDYCDSFLLPLQNKGVASMDDSDLVETQASINIIDPFTKKTMVDPVKSNVCGHSYERSNIVSKLSVKSKMRCPYLGCNQILSKSNLVSDEVLLRHVKALNKLPSENT